MDAQLAARLRALRSAAGLTLEALAESSGVSRSMISLIERGESSPTANVLDRLAAGLGVTMASLFDHNPKAEASPLARRSDQESWTDPETGYTRRNLSPPGFPSPIDLVEVVLPVGARVAYDSAARSAVVHQQVFVLDGVLELRLGDEVHRLAAGDCLAMQLDRPIAFKNRSDAPTRYLVTHGRRTPRTTMKSLRTREMLVIRQDDLTGDATRALLALHLSGMHENSPPGHVFALDLSGLQATNVTVWSAWDGNAVAGIGALKELGDGSAEVKSMRTHPEHLRKGVGAALLEHIIGAARARGLRRLSLETGRGPAFEPALALYRKRGFIDGAAFGDYVRSEFNQFLHLEL